MSAQLFCKLLLISAAAQGNSDESHPPRVLHSEMTEPADTVDCDNIAAARAGIPQSVIHGHACAHKRTYFLRRQLIGHRRDSFRSDKHVFRVTAVEVDS